MPTQPQAEAWGMRGFDSDMNYADFSGPKTYENALSGLLRALETGRQAVLAEGEV